MKPPKSIETDVETGSTLITFRDLASKPWLKKMVTGGKISQQSLNSWKRAGLETVGGHGAGTVTRTTRPAVIRFLTRQPNRMDQPVEAEPDINQQEPDHVEKSI